MDKISTQILFKSGKKITNEYRHINKKKIQIIQSRRVIFKAVQNVMDLN
jgi:hypothetical protein